MMIPMKDIRYPTPMLFPQPHIPPMTNLRWVAIILAVIHTLYSLYCFLLDFSSIFFLIQSGQYGLALLFLIIGSLKHLCQVIWFVELLDPSLNPYHQSNITKIIIGAGLGVLGISLGGYIMLIYMETHSMIEVMTHPHVIEFTTFVLADTFMLLVLLEKQAMIEQYIYSQMKYAPVPQQAQPQEIEMVSQQLPYGFTFVPAQ